MLRPMFVFGFAIVACATMAQAQVMTRTVTTTTQAPPVANGAPGDYCREYTQTFTIAGKTQKGYGTACLQPDGSWEIQSPSQTPGAVAAPAPQGQTTETIQYVTRDERVYVVPPEPFVSIGVGVGGGYYRGRGYDRGYYDRGFYRGPHR